MSNLLEISATRSRVQVLDDRMTVESFRDRYWEFGLDVTVLVTQKFCFFAFHARSKEGLEGFWGDWGFSYATYGLFSMLYSTTPGNLLMDRTDRTG